MYCAGGINTHFIHLAIRYARALCKSIQKVSTLKQLLASTGDLYITLDELPTRYEQYFQKTFNLKSHGLSCLEDLRDKLNNFMKVNVLDFYDKTFELL